MREELERRAHGKFAVFHGTDLLGASDDLELAAQAAVERFGREPYLIRQIGVEPDYIPPAVIHSHQR